MKGKIFYFYLNCLLLPFLGLSQDESVDYRALLLVEADYFEFQNGCDVEKNMKRYSISRLECSGIEGIDFIRVQYRDLKKLQAYFQINYLKKGGNIFDLDDEEYRAFFAESYSLSSIDSLGFYERVIGKQAFINNQITWQCDFVLAYSKLDDRFFKLKGFRYNEFGEFFFTCLMSPVYLSPSILNDANTLKKAKKNVVGRVKVEDLNIPELYKIHAKKTNVLETKSCYRRDWILIN